jgi:hypothetical protein
MEDLENEEHNMPFTIEESCKRSSPGPVDIHYQMLKQMPLKVKEEQLNECNRIWEQHTFPKEWIEALVVPVYKPGKDPSYASSYRPITLTSCVCSWRKW